MTINPTDVIICGYDMLSAAGKNIPDAWRNLLEFSSSNADLVHKKQHLSSYGLHPNAEQDVGAFLASSAGHVVRDHDRAAHLLAALSHRLSTTTEFFVPPSRCGVVVGSSRGATGLLENAIAQHAITGRVTAKTSPLTSAGVFSSLIAHQCGFSGGHFSLSSTCTSGLNAIGTGYHLIKSGLFDGCLAGATEAPLTPFTQTMLKSARVTTQTPNSMLQSLGSQSQGMMLGEGAALFFLCAQDKICEKDGIQLGNFRARIAGFAMATEAAGLTGISERAESLQRAVHTVLEHSGWNTSDVDVIVPHGSGTQRGDHAEALAYQDIFGQQMPPIFPTKWITGHTLGVAGPQALCFALEMLRHQTLIPPPYPLLQGLHARSPQKSLRRAIVCGLGFGGGASCLAIEKNDPAQHLI